MSKAFTPADAPLLPPPVVMPSGRRPVTAAGMARHREALASLRRQHQALAGASGQDASSRQQQLELDGRMAVLARRIALSDLMPAACGEAAGFGSSVVVRRTGGPPTTYRLVGPDEADPTTREISHASPLGRALMGARANDEVIVHRPKGDLLLEVLAVLQPASPR